MIKPFARVEYSERDNYLTYLSKTDMYKDKIVFIEGDTSGRTPYEIYVGDKKYAEAGEIFYASDAWAHYTYTSSPEQ